MNMDQLANLAEILGGIAVISSLICVGAQIRQILKHYWNRQDFA